MKSLNEKTKIVGFCPIMAIRKVYPHDKEI